MYKSYEINVINWIKCKINVNNLDNITRTNEYLRYYKKHPEILWALLAHFVSRNAGWNMTDLQSPYFKESLSDEYQMQLFQTYERANWLIFLDAYPQLLVYEVSKRLNRPFFHLLKQFSISEFMIQEWTAFWKKREKERLMTALIINEQHVIEKPVLNHPLYKRKVFKSLPYHFQDWLHLSAVFLPTMEGNLYGYSVHHFTNVYERIELGKQLSFLLYHSILYPSFYKFACQTPHTGSRDDYGQFMDRFNMQMTPRLKDVYPVISHHRHDCSDWYKKRIPKKLWKPVQQDEIKPINRWYEQKILQLHLLLTIQKWVQ